MRRIKAAWHLCLGVKGPRLARGDRAVFVSSESRDDIDIPSRGVINAESIDEDIPELKDCDIADGEGGLDGGLMDRRGVDTGLG
jgi:hypothetical protein